MYPRHRKTAYALYRTPPIALGASPVRQAVWGRLAVGNFFLSGTGAGAYVLAVLLSALSGDFPRAGFEGMHRLAPALVLAGLLSVALEAGRPLRGLRVLTNLCRSWMSRELLAGLLFVLLALSHTVWPSDFLKALATAAALMLLVSQGLILYWARGIPAWNQRWLPVLFLSSGLLTGTALLLGCVLLTQTEIAGRRLLGVTALGLTLIDLGCWLTYLRQPPTTTALEQSLRCLTRPWPLGSIVGGGHVLPLVLLGVGLYPGPASFFLLLAACVALLLGGLCLKDHLVTRAGYHLELPIPWLAQRPLPSVNSTVVTSDHPPR